MKGIQKMLEERALPPLLEREEMLRILQEEEYGFLPPPPLATEYKVTENCIPNFCAGKAFAERVDVTVTLKEGVFTFPFYAAIPTKEGPHPVFVHISFRDAVPDRYMPTEELIDEGYAVLFFCYKDVTSDDGDFRNGLAGVLYPDGVRREGNAPGKIALWAWAAHRVMDWAEKDGRLDGARCAVCGHSRLGKTALLAAATDERFSLGISNDSGCSGAAITREKVGETVADICRVFPYWFCENYQKYVNNEAAMPFDQHFLVAAIAPRCAYIASAVEDVWADPLSEMLAAHAAAPAWGEVLGFRGEDRAPQVGDEFHLGAIGYHLRAGTHYYSREDWLRAISFRRKKGI